MRYSFYFTYWENPIQDKKPPPQPVMYSLLSTPQPISIKKASIDAYSFFLVSLLPSEPIYSPPFFFLAEALLYNKTAVRPVAVGTIL